MMGIKVVRIMALAILQLIHRCGWKCTVCNVRRFIGNYFSDSYYGIIKSIAEISGTNKENILTLTPIGTSMEDVIKVIEINKKWEVRYISYEQGYLYQEQANVKLL